MKLAAVIVLAFILVTLMILLIAGLALSAVRRARLRGDDKGALDFSDSETVRFTRELLEAREAQAEDPEDEPPKSL
jgi:hypothetical protein